MGDDAAAVGEQLGEHGFVCVENGVDMFLAKAEGGLAKGVAEEAADAAVPGLHPREHAVAVAELLLKLVHVRLDETPVDDPLAGAFVELKEPERHGARGEGRFDVGIARSVAMHVHRSGLASVEV